MGEATIASVSAREILNGRGIPAVEVEVVTSAGLRASASSPSGVSTSAHEAIEVRDGGDRYRGRGVLRAVENVERAIGPRLQGMVVADQWAVDQAMIELDGTPLKSRLGGNAITAVSLAVAKAGAASAGLEVFRYLGGARAGALPVMCPNLLSGSPTAGNALDFEDYLIVPFGFSSVAESLRAGTEVFYALHERLRSRFGLIPQITALAPPLETSEEALDCLVQAIGEAGYAGRIGLGIDAAAGQLYDESTGRYALRRGNLTASELIEHYAELCRRYPILFIEDGLQENDFGGFAEMRRRLTCLVVGDDLFASSAARLARAAQEQAANAILLKVNQVGTVSEALVTANAAQALKYDVVASVRSGETDDAVQVDLAVAGQALLMKVGAPIRGEMVTKYNRLMAIERRLGGQARFRGREVSPEQRATRGLAAVHGDPDHASRTSKPS
jgi:enolase